MALFDGLAKRLGYIKAQVNSAPAWLQADYNAANYAIPERKLPEAQLELYQRLSWVQIAVSQVAESAATTAFTVKELQGEKRRDIENHPFELRLMRPNPLESRFEFLVATFGFLSLTGNAYWWLNRSNDKAEPDEMWVIPSHKIKPVPDGKMFIRGYVYEPDANTTVPLEPHEVVHFKKWHPLNQYVGLSPVESFAVDAEGELAMQKWNTNLFGKDNAKVPGALAFADPINDSDWQRMKDEIRKEHGGVKRSLMMLRNVGQGGVQWVQMAMSQNDMQFLQGRTFTKEEIYSIYAPGLASILAVNATEANSVAGKATFIGMGVWPKLVHVAEKITNDILPAYGNNLIGEFEDIRPADKLLELQEQAAAERVMTVDEIRERFYNEKPIGDERGSLLVIETSRLSPQIEVKEPEPVAQPQLSNTQPDEPDEPEDTAQQQNEQNRQMLQADKPQQPDNAPAKRAEMKAFKAWLKKRPNADIHTFKAEYLTHDELHDIAEDVREVATEQPPFDLPTAFTHDSVKAMKQMLLQLDPDDDEAEQKIRMELERRSARNIDKAFTEMLNTLYPQGYDGNGAAFIDPQMEASRIQRAFREEQALRDAVSRAIQDSADLGISVAVGTLEGGVGFGFDYTLTHESARQWALQYTDTLLEQMGVTSGRVAGQAVARWFENGENLQSLISDLEPVFGKKRAERIAATEVTRAAAEGSRRAFIDSGVVNKVMWRTARDERVCPQCGPLEGSQAGMDGVFRGNVTVPAHPNCRCWIVPVIE